METAYCSIRKGEFVYRGFLNGPLCPIYGVGALLMVMLLNRFTYSVPLFLLISTVTMSAWEYLVGWFLETTTHIKYWDYSEYRFNLKGRICLKNSTYWGIISYICIFYVHPATVRLFAPLKAIPRRSLAATLAVLILADTVLTIRSLALTAAFFAKAEETRHRLEKRRAELKLARQQRRDEAALQAALLRMELEHMDLLAEAAHHSRRFRRYYQLSSTKFTNTLRSVHAKGEQLRKHRAERIAKLRELRK